MARTDLWRHTLNVSQNMADSLVPALQNLTNYVYLLLTGEQASLYGILRARYLLQSYLGRGSGFLAALCCIIIALLPIGEALDKWTLDWQFALRGRRTSTAKVVVIARDEATEAHGAWGDSPQVAWGTHYARTAQQALDNGAVLVGLDVVPGFDLDAYFDSLPVSSDVIPRPNRALALAIQESDGKIVLAQAATASGKQEPLSPELSRTALIMGDCLGWLDFPPRRAGTVQDGLLFIPPDAAATSGNSKGRTESGIRPGLAALLAARIKGLNSPTQADFLRLAGGRAVWRTENGHTPVAAFGINWTMQEIPRLSAVKVELNKLTPHERGLLQGSVVLIGATAQASKDWHPTRFGAPEPGVFIHAAALTTLLDDRPLRWLPPITAPLLTALLGLPLAFLLIRVTDAQTKKVSGLLCLAMAGVVISGQAAFALADWVVPFACPLLAITSVPLFHFAGRFGEEMRRRQEMRLILSGYFSPTVADYLLHSEENRKPGGLEGTATCLFLDLRDSTQRASAHAPAVLMRDLNEMFGLLVPVVQEKGGAVLKYMGDGLLALYNVPTPAAEGDGGAQAAVDSALAMQSAMETLNHQRHARDPQNTPLRIGIGIHQGPVVYGNLGSVDRPEFTVIGATVNIAARLESLTKPDALNVPLVVSESVYQALLHRPAGVAPPKTCDLRGYGAFVVRGIPQPPAKE